ncbi:MAG: metallophosphoesterase [Bacteroidota bacterium]
MNAQTISKGPYLIYPLDNTQMTVLWQLSATSSCTLIWGTDLTYSIGTTNTTEYSTSTHQHKYTITGLTPGTKYYYKVSFGTTNLTGSFTSAPDNSATKVSVYGWGDTRDGATNPEKVTTAIDAEIAAHPEYQTLITHSGDWVAADAESNWTNEFFNRTNDAHLLTMQATLAEMGVKGNHEGNGVYFKQYFPYNYPNVSSGCYYSFDYGPVHYTVIDQYNTYTSGSAQYNWLVNDLSTSTKKWKIILLHEPGWSAGGGHANNTTVQTTIQPLCVQYHVSMVVAGHNHYYARGVVSNVVHLTLGGGGAAAYTPASGQSNIVITSTGLSYMRFDFDTDTLHAYAMNDAGSVIDSYTLINATTNVENNEHKSTDVRIIPNPSCGKFDIYCNQDLRGSDFEIYNINGLLVKKVHNANDVEKTSIDVCGQDDGTYILKAIIKGVPITSRMMLIQR